MVCSSVALLFAVLVILSIAVFGHHQEETHESPKESTQARFERAIRLLEASTDAAEVPVQKSSSAPAATSTRAQANTQDGRCLTSITVSHANPTYTVDLYYYGLGNAKPIHTGIDWDDKLMFTIWNKTHWILLDAQSDGNYLLAVGKETTTAAEGSQVKTWMRPRNLGKSPLTFKCAGVPKVNKKACTTQLNVKGFTSSADSYLNGVYLYDGVFSGKSYYRGSHNASFVYVYWMDSRTVTGWCISNFLGGTPCDALSVGITDTEPTTVAKWKGYYAGDDSLTLTCTKGTSAKCAKFKCGSGYVLRDNAQYLTCKGAKCTDDECCHVQSCAKYACPNSHGLRTDAAQMPCWTTKCLPTECCLGKCSAMDCGNGTPREDAPELCSKHECKFDECCKAGEDESSWY